MSLQKLLVEIKRLKKGEAICDERDSRVLQGIKESQEADDELIGLLLAIIHNRGLATLEISELLGKRQQIKEELK